MTRVEAIAKAKELGLKLERPAHQTATAILVAKIEAHEAPKGERGRKINPNSARQQRLAARKALVEAGDLKLGRRVDPTSARQARLTAIEARIANGEVIKRGRPALVVE